MLTPGCITGAGVLIMLASVVLALYGEKEEGDSVDTARVSAVTALGLLAVGLYPFLALTARPMIAVPVAFVCIYAAVLAVHLTGSSESASSASSALLKGQVYGVIPAAMIVMVVMSFWLPHVPVLPALETPPTSAWSNGETPSQQKAYLYRLKGLSGS